MPDEVSLGEPTFVSFPHSELSDSEDSDIFATARMRLFAQSVLSAEAWFHIADELIAAMNLLEPHVERFWEDVRSVVFIVDKTSDVPSKQQMSDPPSKHQTTDAPSKHSLISQHMM